MIVDFYVYTLADPRTKEVFYVGKGKGKRAWQHVAEVRSGKISNQAKHDRIQAILKSNREPVVRIVRDFLREKEALDLEAQMIATLPNLTNIATRGAPGGDRSLNLYKWLETVEKWPNGPTFPGMYNGHIEAHNFVVQVRRLLAEKDSTEIPDEGRQEAGRWKTGRVTQQAYAGA